MKFRPSYRSIWGISYPLLIAGVSETIVDITDTIFLARYGITELAAIGLADTVYGLALFASIGLADGIQIIIGRRSGEEKNREIGNILNQGLYILILIACLFIAIILFIVPPLTAELFSSADIHAAVHDYLDIAVFGLFFHSFTIALGTFFVGIGKTRILIGATAILAVTNILLDYCLIFGNLGFPRLGIEGAAIASVSAEFSASVLIAIYILKKRYTETYNIFRFGRWNSVLSAKLIRLSAPVSAETLVEEAKWLLFFLIIERLGEVPLATASIIFSCYAFFLIPVEAFSETVCSMVSNLIGQDRTGNADSLIRKTISLSYFIVAPLLILVFLYPENVLAVFTDDKELVEGSGLSLYVVAAALCIAIPAESFLSAVAGTGDTVALLIIQFVVTSCSLLYAVYAALVLGLALEYIWICEIVGWALCLLLSWIWFRTGYWQRLII